MAGGSNAGYISQEVARNIFPTSAAGTHTKQPGLPAVCIQPSGMSLAHEDLRNLYHNMRAMHPFKADVKCHNQSYCYMYDISSNTITVECCCCIKVEPL